MSNIKIIADSPGDIPQELVKKYNIEFLPVSLHFNDKDYRDYLDITPEEFYDILPTLDEVPTTSQIRVPEFEDAFRKTLEDGFDTIICFTLAQEASGTFNNANLAKNMILEEYPNADITVVSGSLSYIYGRLAVEAAKLAAEGAEKEEILKTVNNMAENSAHFFVVDTLKYLKKGGRISPTVAGIGDILNIKPILAVKNGLVTSVDKVRGSKKVIPKLISFLKDAGIENATEVYIFDGKADPANISAVKAALKENFNIEDTAISVVGPVIGLHTGPGIYGVLFFK